MRKQANGIRWIAGASLSICMLSPALAQVASDPQWLVRTTVMGVLTNASSQF